MYRACGTIGETAFCVRICLKTVEAGKIERRPLPTSVHRLERTQSFREQETKLFLTYQKPHHAVSASTISRWIKSMLKRAGVDSSKFGAHSTMSFSIILLKLFVTLKPGYFFSICLSNLYSYLWFWLFVKVTCRYTYTGWVVIKEFYYCIAISSLYLSWLQTLT